MVKQYNFKEYPSNNTHVDGTPCCLKRPKYSLPQESESTGYFQAHMQRIYNVCGYTLW